MQASEYYIFPCTFPQEGRGARQFPLVGEQLLTQKIHSKPKLGCFGNVVPHSEMYTLKRYL